MNSKILMTGWGYPPKIDGGLDIHVKHLFEELQRRDVNVTLVLPKDRAPENENIIGVEVGDGDMVQKARLMSQEVAKMAEDYDIIHTHDWFGAEAGFKSKKYSDVKWVSTLHSLSSNRTRNGSKELEKLEKISAEQSDTTISVSETLRDEVKDLCGADSEVIYNGFSTPPSTGADIKERLGIEGDMIFFVGRHAEQKGIEHLLYGFKKVLNERDAKLVIGGKGHMTESLKKFAEILEIGEDVLFTGFIPREFLGDYYRDSDVFVSPSINEPFGLTITEALESGTPVVATKNGAEEILEDSIISVDAHSESLKDGIIRALEMEKAVKYENRSWSDMANETIEVYEKLSKDK